MSDEFTRKVTVQELKRDLLLTESACCSSSTRSTAPLIKISGGIARAVAVVRPQRDLFDAFLGNPLVSTTDMRT